MCFSNLPIEFDEAGNPYLSDDADEVEHVADCGCGTDVAIHEDDPEAAFEAVASSIPESVREDAGWQIDDASGDPAERDANAETHPDERAGGD